MIADTLEALRKYSFGIFMVLVITFIVLVYFLDVGDVVKQQEDAFVMDGTYVRIVKRGNLKWEVWTREIAVEREEETHRLEDIYKGIMYRKDKPPFNFRADRGIYNSRTDEVHLEGNIEFSSSNGDYFQAERVDWYGKPERMVVPVPLVLKLDGNTYNAQEMESIGDGFEDVRLRGDVVVEVPNVEESGSDEVREDIEESNLEDKYLKNLVLEAQFVTYEGDPKKFLRCYPETEWKVIHVPGEEPPEEESRVLLRGDDFIIKSKEMYADFNKKYARAVGDVWILREGEEKPDEDLSDASKALRKKDTIIETEEVFYYWKEEYVKMPGALEMYQEGMDLAAGRGYMDTERNTVSLAEGVRMHQEEGGRLVEDGVVEEDASEKVKEASKQETEVTCEMLDVDFDTEDLSARGDVFVKQEKRKLAGTAAVFDSEAERWTVYGRPLLEEEKHRVVADTLVYDQEEGIYEALGSAELELAIEEENYDDIEEFYSARGEDSPGPLRHERAVVYADRIRHDEVADVTYANDGARVVYRDIVARADSATVNHGAETATGTGNVVITDPRTEITADEFMLDRGEKRVELRGGVRLADRGRPANEDNEEQEPFELEGGRLEYYWRSRSGTAEGDVILRSPDGDRWAAADRLEVDRDRETYIFTGNVHFHQESGDWLLDRGDLDEEDEETRAVAMKPTDVTCNRSVINNKEKTIVFEGGVRIKQPQKELRADIVRVDERSEKMTADGNVFLSQSRGQWLFEGGFVKEDADSELKKRLAGPMQITASSLESLYGEKKMFLSGGVKVSQGRNTAEAGKMWRYGESGQVILEEDVRINYDSDRTMRAEKIVYNPDEDIFQAYRSVQGRAEVSSGDETGGGQ